MGGGKLISVSVVNIGFATLETELLDRNSLTTRKQARSEVFDYIEGFCNPHRRHSAIGYHSSSEYERSTELPC